MPSTTANMDNNKSKSVHVFTRRNRWAVKKYGAKRVLRVVDNKVEAILLASKYWEKGYTLVVHRRDGSVDFWKFPKSHKKEVA